MPLAIGGGMKTTILLTISILLIMAAPMSAQQRGGGPKPKTTHAAPAPKVKTHVSGGRSEEHTSELQSLAYLVCRLLLEKKKKRKHVINESSEHILILSCHTIPLLFDEPHPHFGKHHIHFPSRTLPVRHYHLVTVIRYIH